MVANAARLTLPLLMVALLGMFNSSEAAAALPDADKANPQRYIVLLRSGVDQQRQAMAERQRGNKVTEVFSSSINGYTARLDSSDLWRLQQDPTVAAIEPDQQFTAQGAQDRTTSLWNLDRLDQRALPGNGRIAANSDGAGVRAYIVDTGIRSDHQQFAGRVSANGYDAISDGNGTEDCYGHGTHVAGTVGGQGYGVAPGSTLVPVRVLDCEGKGWSSDIIAGMDWAISDHQPGQPAVANLSLGGGYSETFNLAVQRMINDGITVAVAAGNSNGNACNESPASAPQALTVGATGSNDQRSWFSNFGSCLDLFAPGSNIVSAAHTSSSGGRSDQGTSMAAPHVAGAAALLLSLNPNLSPAEVTELLVNASTKNVVGDPGSNSPNRLLYLQEYSPPQPDTPPSNSTAPTISGSLQVGQTLAADPGAWSGTPTPSFAYQWRSCDSGGGNCQNISSATSSSLSLDSGLQGKRIVVRVTGSNSAGTTSADSAASEAVQAAPNNISPPTISGTARVGQTLTASPGSWGGTPTPSFTYQWRSCDSGGGNCQNISSATSSSLSVDSGLQGKRVVVRVTGSNALGSASADSTATAAVEQQTIVPSNTSPPTISGTARVGQTLTANPGSWSGTPTLTFTYQWRSCDSDGNNCQNINSATSSSLLVDSGLQGKRVVVRVTGSNSAGTASADSAASAAVQAASNPLPTPTLNGPDSQGAITFSGAEENQSYLCLIGSNVSGPLAPCTSPYLPLGLTNGQYSYRLAIRAADGQTSAEAQGVITVSGAPAPPSSGSGQPQPAGIVINNKQSFSTKTTVNLSLSWPAGARKMALSNQLSATSSQPQELQTSLPWSLANSDGRQVVSVQFIGPGQQPLGSYQAAITVDRQAPVISSGVITRQSGKQYWVRVKASDQTSGVNNIQFSSARQAPSSGPRPSLAYSDQQVVKVTMNSRPRWYRVSDRAGNISPWRSIAASK